ncbi:MAG: hypothetical protein ETSY1_07510 [Candidatus Entotheonella factor]|uniref:Uncharacterized protein n=1 Tax=Entotheonella factor TaxID=1429438 RepID=W4LTN0_ENTF1|nr:hypothetical protein [Candidatus Entotheonella palauensis]ETX01404.1 MAG: hypothetical protein ETSY1_07510 [Candidatus Entotheonella factor]
MSLSKTDPSHLNIRNVYRSLPPEKRAEQKRLAELEDQDIEYWRGEGDKINTERMKSGLGARSAIAALRRLARRKGLSDEELMACSGLDAAALASMSGRDARPTIETMEAYARALGKKLLIVLADEEAET